MSADSEEGPGHHRYRKLADEIRREFGERIGKVAIDAGFTCPTRDGTLGRGGCTYCDPAGSGPGDGRDASIEEQVRRRRRRQRFIAYLQAFTNTYGSPERLDEVLARVAAVDGVAAIAVGTRPDCVPEPVLHVLERWSRTLPLWVEYGLESAHARTLERVRRGHTVENFVDAVERTHARGIRVVAHVILGLPGEDREAMLETAQLLTNLRVDGVKIHPLHIVRGSVMAAEYERGEIRLFSRDEYAAAACDFLERLDSRIVIHRLTGGRHPDIHVAPAWALDKAAVLRAIEAELERRNSRQGCASEAAPQTDEARFRVESQRSNVEGGQ